MPQYCVKCGAQNEDQAAFCTACGAKLLNPDLQAPQVQQGASGVSTEGRPPSTIYHSEWAAGEHAHILTEMKVTDDNGSVVCIAKRPSLIHESLDIVDPEGQVVGHVNRKLHLNASTFIVSDRDEKAAVVVQVKGAHQRGVRPTIWLEDATGTTIAQLQYQGLQSFALLKSDGTFLFTATFVGQGGFRQEFRDLAASKHTIEVFDQALPVWQMVGVLGAVYFGTA